MALPVLDSWLLYISICDWNWAPLPAVHYCFHVFVLSWKSMCGFAMLLTYERHPCLTGAEKRISRRFKKKKSRHAWQQQYKHTSYHTCSTSPVWCDKNHHIGWEAWQTVGRHAQTQHNPIDITCLGALCTTELRRGRTCTLQNGFNATNTNLTWHIIRSVLFPRKAAKKV